jgi:predicted O-methyltransferase YrrM
MLDRQSAIARELIVGKRYNTPDERGFLYDLARRAPDGLAVELGVLFGGSFVTWTPAREGRGEIVAVDNWVNGVNAIPNVEAGFRKNCEHFGIQARIITSNSWDARKLVGERIAFCFVDADHMEGVAKDIRAYAPRMMPGGIMAFHDYYISKPIKVRSSVDAWIRQARWPSVGTVGSVVAFRRPT